MALPWIGGLLAGHFWQIAPEAAFGASLLLGASAGVLWRLAGPRPGAAACLLAAVCAFGVARMAVWDARLVDSSAIAPLANGPAEAVGRVSTDPRISGRRWRFGVVADTVRTDSLAAVGGVAILVTVDTAVGIARAGERVRLYGTLRMPPHARAPGLFDYGAYLRRQGYAATLSVHTEGALAILPGGRGPWTAFWSGARAYVRRAIRHGHDPVHAGLMTGLLLGDRSGLPRQVLTEFQRCGVLHVLAVSGLHVGIILVGVSWPLRRLFGRRKWQIPLLIVVAWSYAALTGGNPPVVRASIMATVFLLSMAVARTFDAWNALALSALVTLVMNPGALIGASFQLSYTAMIGLLWVGDRLQVRIERAVRARRSRWAQYGAGLVAGTIAAHLTTWPLVAHHFGNVPLLGLVASPVIVALVTVAVWGGMVSVAVGWIPGVVSVLNWLIAWPLEGALGIGSWAASLPLAARWVRPPTWVEVAAYGLALWAIWQVARRRGAVLAVVAAALLFGNLWVWSAWAHRRTGSEFAFLDVGQGDATLCTFANGATILVDGGAATPWYDAGEWTVVPYCRARGIRRIDVVVATHADNDHVGGLASVLRNLEVGELWHNGTADTSESFRQLLRAAKDENVPVRRVAAGDSIAGLGHPAHILGPPTVAPLLHLWPENDRSIVLRAVVFGRSLLLVGDAGRLEEGWLLRTADTGAVRADILKVGHHGSASSGSDRFLDAVSPRWAIISVGANNPYGHPSPLVLARLDARAVEVLRTDDRGTVVWHAEADTAWWRATVGSDVR